jgi:hypothetical protein
VDIVDLILKMMAIMFRKMVFIGIVQLVAVSCQSEENASEVVFSVRLEGKNLVPANATAALGQVEAVYDREKKILSYTITYSGITPNAWHIHREAIGNNSPLVFNLGTTFMSPYKNQTVVLTAAQEADLLKGLWYLDIHSALFAAGEVRGQLLPL